MQFEKEPLGSYYGTYTDNIMFGSFLSGSAGRKVVGSAVSGSLEYQYVTCISEYAYTKANPGYRSPSARSVPLFASNTVYADSVMPDAVTIYQMGGGQVVYSPTGYYGTVVDLHFSTNGYVTGSDHTNISNTTWFRDQPFVNKYAGVPRGTNTWQSFTPAYLEEEDDDTSPGIPLVTYSPTTTTISPAISIGFKVTNVVAGGIYTINAYTDKKNNSVPFYEVFEQGYSGPQTWVPGLSNSSAYKFFFGFEPTAISNQFVNYFDNKRNIKTGLNIRGWKYGVLSGIPTPPKAIWRIGKFGQMRDMLEQRVYSKTYNQTNQSTDGPIFARFVSGSLAAYTASNPELNTLEAGYYNIEYRSALPFFDV